MTEEYVKPVLTGRELTPDEQYILYGKPSGNDMTYFKSDSFENLVSLMESVYNGEVVDLPMAPKNNCMYLFFDTPVGTKHYFYDMNSHNPTPRTSIGETSLVEMKYLLNGFLLPKIIDGFTKIDPNRQIEEKSKTPGNIYPVLGIRYENLAEIFSGGLFVNTNGTTVVSITTGMVKAKAHETIFSNSKNAANFKTNHEALLINQRKEQIGWYNYSIPNDVQKRSNLPETQVYGTPVLSSKMFEWAKSTYIVISNKYLRINGFVVNEEVPNLAISFGPILTSFQTQDYTLQRYVNTISSYVESFIFSGNNYGWSGMSKMFTLGTTTGPDIGYYSPKNSIICFNKDSLEILDKPYMANVQYTEHINLGSGILGELRDNFVLDGKKGAESYAKAEFKLNPDPLGTEADYTSSRYDIVKTEDHKLMFITKTSLAKEALKQAKISRKITETCSPVINFVVNLFAACDLEFAGTNRAAAIVTYSKAYSGASDTTWACLAPELTAVYQTVMTNFRNDLAVSTPRISKEIVDDLYSTFAWSGIFRNFDNYKTIANLQTGRSYGRETLLRQANLEAQKQLTGAYLFKDMVNCFARTLFSPSSNQLNYVSLAENMYKNFVHAKIPNTLGLSHNNGHLTGATLAHFYPNNFISIDENLDKMIERGKGNTYVHVSEANVPISTCFTWSQEASDSFGSLKKCKTFTDYYSWYKALYPTIQAKISILRVEDEIGATSLTNISHAYLTILEGMSVAETPYLPAPKTRGRKKKEVTTTEDETTEETNEPVSSPAVQ